MGIAQWPPRANNCTCLHRLQAYWENRLPDSDEANNCELQQSSLTREAVLQHLRGEGQLHTSLETPCRLCDGSAVIDCGLTGASCGVHHTPLCQLTLAPILFERHLLCGLCGRLTLCLPEGSLRDK